jgi:hypothetical protein
MSWLPGSDGIPVVPTVRSKMRPFTAFTAASTADFDPVNCSRTDTGSSGPTDCVSRSAGRKCTRQFASADCRVWFDAQIQISAAVAVTVA